MEPLATSLWRYRKRIVILCGDVFLAALSYAFAFLLRFEMSIPPPFLSVMLNTLPWIVIIWSITFWYLGLYRGLRRFASIQDLLSIVKATSASSVFILLCFYLIHYGSGYPISVFFIDWLILTVLVGGSRFSLRLLREIKHLRNHEGRQVDWPGEKLSEELFDPEGEELVSTEHGKISMISWKGPCNYYCLLEHTAKLERSVDCLDSAKLVRHVRKAIQESRGSVSLGDWNS